MVQRVYLETSIVSYLSARPSRDLITAARQQITHEWWTYRRSAFEICVSELVVAEASAGDRDAAERRAQIIRDIRVEHPGRGGFSGGEAGGGSWPSNTCRGRRAAHLHRRMSRYRLSIDVELDAYRKCGVPTEGG